MPTVTLVSAEDENGNKVSLKVSRDLVRQSELIKTMLADDDDDEESEIPLLEVPPAILPKIVTFLEKHVNDPMKEITKPITTNKLEEIVGDWDTEFVNLEYPELFKLILAANYLDIPSLLELGLCKVACLIKGKDPEEVRKMFDIGEISPEEEKMVREQNSWIFDIAKPAEKTVPKPETAA
jgi:hypothetical protein